MCLARPSGRTHAVRTRAPFPAVRRPLVPLATPSPLASPPVLPVALSCASSACLTALRFRRKAFAVNKQTNSQAINSPSACGRCYSPQLPALLALHIAQPGYAQTPSPPPPPRPLRPAWYHAYARCLCLARTRRATRWPVHTPLALHSLPLTSSPPPTAAEDH